VTTVVITPPEPIVDPETVRARLGMTDAGSGSDANLTALIAAVTQAIDGPAGLLGRVLGRQELQFRSSSFILECGLRLFPPVIGIERITYLDVDGIRQTLDPMFYALSGTKVLPAHGASWPHCRCDPDSVQITYEAGYDDVPVPILHAIILGVGKMQSMARPDMMLKQETVIGVISRSWETQSDGVFDKVALSLLSPYRVIAS